MKIYFAHPVSEYGSPFQAACIKELRSSWHEVESPDAPHHQEGYRQHGMAYFEAVIAGCDALAYLRFPDGTIGAGVGKEIAAAAQAGKPIYEVDVHQGSVHVSASAPNPQPVLSVEHTRLKLGRLAARTTGEKWMTDKLEWHELDAIAKRHPSIKSGYAEATGGQDLPFIIRELASVLEDDGWERKRAIAAIHWVFNADGTVGERAMAQEAIHKINDPTFMPSPPKAGE